MRPDGQRVESLAQRRLRAPFPAGPRCGCASTGPAVRPGRAVFRQVSGLELAVGLTLLLQRAARPARRGRCGARSACILLRARRSSSSGALAPFAMQRSTVASAACRGGIASRLCRLARRASMGGKRWSAGQLARGACRAAGGFVRRCCAGRRRAPGICCCTCATCGAARRPGLGLARRSQAQASAAGPVLPASVAASQLADPGRSVPGLQQLGLRLGPHLPRRSVPPARQALLDALAAPRRRSGCAPRAS